MTEVYLKKIRQDECPSCGKALRQPQTEQGLSVGEIGLVYASAIKAVAEQQTDALKIAREAAIEECINALEADAMKCDCFAFEEDECGCGAWCEWKSITSQRAIEIVRALQELG